MSVWFNAACCFHRLIIIIHQQPYPQHTAAYLPLTPPEYINAGNPAGNLPILVVLPSSIPDSSRLTAHPDRLPHPHPPHPHVSLARPHPSSPPAPPSSRRSSSFATAPAFSEAITRDTVARITPCPTTTQTPPSPIPPHFAPSCATTYVATPNETWVS